jgi:hypothetical protein
MRQFMEQFHAGSLNQFSMGVSWKRLGQHIGEVVSRFDLLDFDLATLYELLCKSENLRADMLGSVRFDEASSYLSHASRVVFEYHRGLAVLGKSALLRDDLVHLTKPDRLACSFVKSDEFRMVR